jgi:Sensors of blue-light using FAD
MPLARIMYHSTVNPAVPPDLRALLAISHKNNLRNGITGFLFFNTTYFLQVIEGERAVVNKLYRLISTDHRHSNLVLIGASDITERAFPAWLMGLRDGMSSATQDAFLKVIGSLEIDPSTIGADEMLDLMQLLALDILAEMAD